VKGKTGRGRSLWRGGGGVSLAAIRELSFFCKGEGETGGASLVSPLLGKGALSINGGWSPGLLFTQGGAAFSTLRKGKGS